jgi:hypothetical protein
LANAGAAAAHPGPALDGVRLFFLATLRDRERFVLPLHGGPVIFSPATRQRQAPFAPPCAPSSNADRPPGNCEQT